MPCFKCGQLPSRIGGTNGSKFILWCSWCHVNSIADMSTRPRMGVGATREEADAQWTIIQITRQMEYR